MIARTAILTAGLAVALAGCSPPDDQETGSVSREEVIQARQSLDPAVVEALDAGNDAYRAGDYESALSHYREANQDGDVAAAWFGIYMAQIALGNAEAADSAMQRAQSLAPGASLIHPEPEENQ
jgi:tetratricopeptide (TPR) repeat protein